MARYIALKTAYTGTKKRIIDDIESISIHDLFAEQERIGATENTQWESFALVDGKLYAIASEPDLNTQYEYERTNLKEEVST